MPHDTRQMLEKIIDYCSGKCWEINQAEPAAPSASEILTGRKLAYKDVLAYANKLIDKTV